MIKMRGSAFLGVILAASLMPVELLAQRRVAVRHRGPRTTVVVHRNHPIRRPLPRTVVVRPARTAVVVGAPLVFLPAVVFAAAVVTLPSRDRLVWEDSETIAKNEDWVDLSFGVDNRGTALMLDLRGSAQLNFAEVTFANGNVQVVDFNDRTHHAGLYTLLDFADGRQVKTVRILARAKTKDAKLTVYMRK